MPRGDRTGPQGEGAMTGRGAGICAGYGVPGYMNSTFGRGFGRGGRYGGGFGMGGGRGWRHRYYATGLPGWARGYDGPYASPARFPVPVVTAVTPKAAQDAELAHLKEQAVYFREAIRDIEARISELQQESANAASNAENKKG